MISINIRSVNCGVCGLPNGEAVTRPGEPCVHCRLKPRAKDIVSESKGEGEERSVWRWRRFSFGGGKRSSQATGKG